MSFNYTFFYGLLYLHLPVFATILTRHENRRGFIRATCLQFIITTFLGTTFLAREHIRGCLDALGIFARIPFHLRFDLFLPMHGVHFLVGHISYFSGGNLPIQDTLCEFGVLDIDVYGSQSVSI